MIVNYNDIILLFSEMLKVGLPIALIFGICASLVNIMLDFIFPRKRGGF